MQKANFKELLRRYDDQPLTIEQLQYIRDLMEKKGMTVADIITEGYPPLERLTKSIASELLNYLKSQSESSRTWRTEIDLTMCLCPCHRINEQQRKIIKVKNCNLYCNLCSCGINTL